MNKKKFAQVLSFATLPLWLPLFISLNFGNVKDVLWASMSSIVLLGTVFFYKNIGLLTSLHMPTRAERLLPLATSVIVYLVFSVLCYVYAKRMYSVYALACTVVFGLYMVSFWDKVSIHVAGITAGTGYIIAFYTWHILSILVGVLVITIVIWARLYLKAHTVKQIILGFLIGAVSFMLSVIYLH